LPGNERRRRPVGSGTANLENSCSKHFANIATRHSQPAGRRPRRPQPELLRIATSLLAPRRALTPKQVDVLRGLVPKVREAEAGY
jgi:hypothetical protein